MADFKKIIEPRKEFVRETKARFLALFDAAHPGHTYVNHGIKFMLRIIAASTALVAVLLGSVSAYADSANVSPNNSLYTFKRLSEDVRLALAAPQAKPELQATFATRRAEEIQEVAATNPTSTLVATLSNDLNTDVDDSVTAAHATQLANNDLDVICGKILGAIASSSVALHGKAPITSKAFLRFENVCAENSPTLAAATTSSTTSSAATTMTTLATPTATSTTSTPENSDRHRFSAPIQMKQNVQGKENKNGEENDTPAIMSSTEVSTTVETSSTTPATSSVPNSAELHIRGGGFLNVIFGHSDENNEGEATAAASTTVFMPDLHSYLESHGKSNLFDSGDSSN